MLISSLPVSSVPISGKSIPAQYSAAIAFTQPASTIVITELENFIAAIALAPATPVFSLTAAFFTGSLTLTQGADSINLANYNGIAPWQAAPVDNTRRRQQEPTLQEIRQNAPILTQIRQIQPMLGE